jgi:hypothetical protein
MKRASILSTLVLAGVTAGLLGSTAAFAGMSDYNQLEQSVKVGLESLQVNTDHLGQLTLDQVAQLSAILDTNDSNADKTMAANHVIESAVNPQPIAMDSPEGRALMHTLKVGLDRVHVTYPSLDKLNAVQVQAVIDVLNHHTRNDSKAKLAVEGALANFDRPATVTLTNAGVRQLEKEMDAKLITLGLTPPARNSITFAQVGDLTAIFDQGGSTADQKTAAMKVLGIS